MVILTTGLAIGNGVDPAPYFRLFNPYTKFSKADPTRDYIRAFVPELKDLYGPGKYMMIGGWLMTGDW